MDTLEKGDRVTRLSDVFDERSQRLFGTVTRRYSDYTSRFGPYPELYEVLWDNGETHKGFFRHGLDKI